MSAKAWLRSAGLGRLAYLLWYQPKARLKTIAADGGLLEARRTELARREMEEAAYVLPLLPAVTASPTLEIHLLTGRRFWYQTVFCLWTFARHSGRDLRPIIYDDGTLKVDKHQPITRLFPKTQFISQADIISRLDAVVPVSRYPALRERWQHYPNIRKLIDPHAGQSGWKLVMDSDLLFFRRPDYLSAWLDHPAKPLHAVDCETSYGYPRPLLNELAGAPVAELLNVGFAGLNSSELDWDKLEFWCRTLIDRAGTHYYLEQALVAMLLAGRDCAIAPAADYITKPNQDEGQACRAVMHHYVSNSKRIYFRHAWREALSK